MIALIPARAGSKRCPGKNTRLLNGHPLIAYTIAAAQQSGVFEWICVCSDDGDALRVAIAMGTRGRARDAVRDSQPDIEWIRHALLDWVPRPASFAILRPTSPFRTAETIRRAYREFQKMADCGDSIRAIRRVTENPYKMWTWAGAGMPIKPLIEGVYMPDLDTKIPLHSCPTQLAPAVYIQTGALEMAYTANVEIHGSISGRKVGGFLTSGAEAFDINTEDDWTTAVRLAHEHPDWLPAIGVASLSPAAETQ
jgi:N-acylneuraminate cytidylyltransferase